MFTISTNKTKLYVPPLLFFFSAFALASTNYAGYDQIPQRPNRTDPLKLVREPGGLAVHRGQQKTFPPHIGVDPQQGVRGHCVDAKIGGDDWALLF